MENINFTLTPDQAKQLCEHYGRDIDTLDENDICELLDTLIDETCSD